MEDERDIASLKHTRKKSSLSLSGCFNRRRGFGSFDCSASTPSPSSWFRSKGQDTSPEIKPRSRMGRHRRHSSDFSYDPLSYALNFEDEVVESEESPVRSFASRLPTSPPRRNVESLNERLDALDLKRRVESSMPRTRPAAKKKANSEGPTPRSPLSPTRDIFVETWWRLVVGEGMGGEVIECICLGWLVGLWGF